MKTILLFLPFLLAFVYADENDDRVKVNVYIESKCPDSKNFVNEQLYPTYQTLKPIINLKLVPYGNADVTISRGGRLLSYECQHGPDECWGNKYQV